MIPRVIHQIWLGGSPIPELFTTLREILELTHPGWELRLWTEEDMPEVSLDGPLAESFDSLPVGLQADVLRLVLLERFGGWYLDLDMEALRPLQGLEGRGAFIIGEEDADSLGSAVIAAVPGHPLVRRLVRCLHGSIIRNRGLGIMHQTGPAFITRLVRASPDQDRADAWIAPPEVFYPVHWTRQADFDRLRVAALARGTSHLVHHWAGTWRAEHDPWRLTADRLN